MDTAMNELRKIWPEWQIKKQLGRGTFGVVYEAVRYDHNFESQAAIKVISIPNDISEVNSLRSEGLGEDATRTYLQGIVDDFVSEIRVMESFKGLQNIVSVEDYRVAEKTDELGWNIFIRMELLTPFNELICDRKLSEAEVIKLGCDICTALEVCNKRNIIHRDVKPENILVNAFGDYKLGDFGVARQLEHVTVGLSQKGTYNYIAPEVVHSDRYDARVDIYSLGIVLYRLLNKNRLPFLDTDKQLLNPYERKHAIDRRLRGEMLPDPCDASPKMAEIVLKACAYDPDQRFLTATEMKRALWRAGGSAYDMPLSLDKPIDVQPLVAETKEKSDKDAASAEVPREPEPIADKTISARRAAPVQASPDSEESTVSIRKAEQTGDQTVSVKRAEPAQEQAPIDDSDSLESTELAHKAPVKRVRMYGNLEPAATVSEAEESSGGEAVEENPTKKKLPVWLKAVTSLLILCLIAGGAALAWWGCGTKQIAVTQLPTKTTYFPGNALDITGCTVTVTNNFGFEREITSGFEYSPAELSKAGNQKVTVTYGEHSAAFFVNVNTPTVSGISVRSKPTKTSYYVGDTIETKGLTLNASYTDGTTKTVSSGFTCSPTKLLSARTRIITVKYGGKTTSFNVTVKKVEVSSISVKNKPTKTSYFVDETLNTSGLALTVKYSNGKTETVSSGFTCSPTKISRATQKIMVNYNGKTTSFDVTVKSVDVSSISVNSKPSKTSYYTGDTLNTSGLTLNVKYSNGKTETVSSGFTCSPERLWLTGVQKITVTYKGKTASFNVSAEAEKEYLGDGTYCIYEYDSKGNSTRMTLYNTDGTMRGYEIFERNSNGKKITATRYSPDGTIEWIDDKFDSNGYYARTTYYNTDGTVSIYLIFERNSNGNLTKQTCYNPDGTMTAIYEYDSNGRIAKTIDYNPDGTIKQFYTQDEYYSNGHIKKLTMYRLDGTVMYICEYDSNGKIAKTTYYNSDGTVDRITYGE